MFKHILLLALVASVAVSQPARNSAETSNAIAQDQPLKPETKPADVKATKTKQAEQPNDLTMGQIVDRLTEAVRMTLQQERQSIAKALKSLQEAGNQSLKASMDAAASGFDMFLVVPKFGKNILLTGNN